MVLPEVRALVADMQRAAFDLQLREGAEELELDPPVSQRLTAIDLPVTVAIGDRDVTDFARVAERLNAELLNAGTGPLISWLRTRVTRPPAPGKAPMPSWRPGSTVSSSRTTGVVVSWKDR